MNHKIIFQVLLILTLASGCTSKSHETIAIDVLLTVPEDVYRHAIELNQTILKANPDNFSLDDRHIPHITLLQCYVNEHDLSRIERDLSGLYETVKIDSLWADHLQYNNNLTTSFASIGIAKSEVLMTLHEAVIELVEPYILPDGPQEAYVPNDDGSPIDDFTIAYVPEFISDHSYEHFNPHISLGVAPVTLLDSLARHRFKATKFKPTGLAVYQLGNFGTAQKLIWSSK